MHVLPLLACRSVWVTGLLSTTVFAVHTPFHKGVAAGLRGRRCPLLVTIGAARLAGWSDLEPVASARLEASLGISQFLLAGYAIATSAAELLALGRLRLGVRRGVTLFECSGPRVTVYEFTAREELREAVVLENAVLLPHGCRGREGLALVLGDAEPPQGPDYLLTAVLGGNGNGSCRVDRGGNAVRVYGCDPLTALRLLEGGEASVPRPLQPLWVLG